MTLSTPDITKSQPVAASLPVVAILAELNSNQTICLTFVAVAWILSDALIRVARNKPSAQ